MHDAAAQTAHRESLQVMQFMLQALCQVLQVPVCAFQSISLSVVGRSAKQELCVDVIYRFNRSVDCPGSAH